jgi:putative ABC transport system permease protein
MDFKNLIKTSLSVLKTNIRRTFLTVLGVVIGVGAVITVMSVGAGAESLIFNQISSIGSDIIGIMPGYSDGTGPPASAMGAIITSLKASDIEAIEKIPGIKATASYVRGIATIQYENQNFDANYVGTTPGYTDVESVRVFKGRFFDESDNRSLSRVVVLGYEASKSLFRNDEPLGKRVKIGKENFQVIGIMEKRGVTGFQNQDELVFIPILTAQKTMLGIDHISMARIKAQNEKDIPMVVEDIKIILRERHGINFGEDDDFDVRATTQALDALGTITGALKFFLSAIAAISLLVGGIGIMNIMLISVNERTREIGLRKAVGATENTIQIQFLLEAIIITLIGGIIGIIIGSAISSVVAIGANILGYSWDLIITWSSIFMGFFVSAIVGVIFGWYPSRHASKLDPVEALHYE